VITSRKLSETKKYEMLVTVREDEKNLTWKMIMVYFYYVFVLQREIHREESSERYDSKFGG